jgi:predicted nucleic acid-binding protein
MQELYAGTRSAGDKRDLDGINRAFIGRGYVVTPEHGDWILAGLLLARYQRLKGGVNPSTHINDILIVLDAAKLGADLVTENSSDMERWRKMLPREKRAFRVERVVRSEHHPA